MDKANPWIWTYSGVKFHFLNPVEDEINIVDIAHHLSNICRFGGAPKQHYSVAQHSIYVSLYVSWKNRLWGLLHDAAESYVGDLPSPLKHTRQLGVYCGIEDGILKVIAKKFRLQWPMPEEVKDVDRRMLATEALQFGLYNDYYNDIGPLKTSIIVFPPEKVEVGFLTWFSMCGGKNES